MAEAPALTARWRNGLFFETDDREFSLSIGGRAQFDVANYIVPAGLRANVPGVVPLEDGVVFRRVRLDASGTIYRTIDFLVQLDFVNAFVTQAGTNRAADIIAPTEVWATFRELPFGNLRVGNQKPPLSFEHLTDSRFLNFMERSVGFDSFVEGFNNGFQPGVLSFDTYAEMRGTWAVGLFKNTRSIFAYNVGPDEHELDGRVTYLPVDDLGCRNLVHVGLGASFRDLDDNQQRFRTRMDVRNSPNALAPLLADTGLVFGRHQGMVIPELAAVSGPWSFQSEYFASWVSGVELPFGAVRVPQGTVFFQSATAEVHYFLTGESREYDRDAGVFGRVIPAANMRWRRGCGAEGWGAWQVALRYTYLDLNNKGIEGGTVHDMTVGLNWFLNPHMKVQWNYSLAHRNVAGTAGDGYINSFGTRLAWDF
jgi:phosphate-selective porin OprO/OprP